MRVFHCIKHLKLLGTYHNIGNLIHIGGLMMTKVFLSNGLFK